MSRMRIVSGFAIAVLLVVGIAFATRFGEDPRTVGSPLIGQPVPDVDVPLLEGGGTLRLRDHVAGSISIINFWASWCVPCRAEHAVLVDASTRYAQSSVEVVGIVYQDDADAAVAFLDELGRGYPSLIDEGSRAAIEFGVFGVPETFFVDQTGTIVAKVNGQVTREIIDDTLQGLLLDS